MAVVIVRDTMGLQAATGAGAWGGGGVGAPVRRDAHVLHLVRQLSAPAGLHCMGASRIQDRKTPCTPPPPPTHAPLSIDAVSR